MKGTLRRFVLDTSGQDLIEYGLLIGIVTIAAITAIALNRSEGRDLFHESEFHAAVARVCHSLTSSPSPSP
jgi:Flp pilus assembly pilin Flp